MALDKHDKVRYFNEMTCTEYVENGKRRRGLGAKCFGD